MSQGILQSRGVTHGDLQNTTLHTKEKHDSTDSTQKNIKKPCTTTSTSFWPRLAGLGSVAVPPAAISSSLVSSLHFCWTWRASTSDMYTLSDSKSLDLKNSSGTNKSSQPTKIMSFNWMCHHFGRGLFLFLDVFHCFSLGPPFNGPLETPGTPAISWLLTPAISASFRARRAPGGSPARRAWRYLEIRNVYGFI